MNTFDYSVEHVTIGKIAKSAGVLPSTVRYYVKEGLLQVTDHTPGGFFLFDRELALKRIKRIQVLKKRRLTIAEIREKLLNEIE
jgi:DNA-binding transcriptional MerR regulator